LKTLLRSKKLKYEVTFKVICNFFLNQSEQQQNLKDFEQFQ